MRATERLDANADRLHLSHMRMETRTLSRSAAIDNAAPASVLGELRDQILASRVRRSSRRSTSNDSGTHWYSLDAPARLRFEQVIQHLRTLVPNGHEYVGAEWWFRATTTDTGFPFHFDRDEGIRHEVVSPDLASILYLGDAGGPTVIVDATPSRRTAPSAAIAVHPRLGRFVMFSGTLLHGVLPGRPSRWPRVTMLVNWWRTVPRMEPAPDDRASARASARWRVGAGRRTKPVALAPFDPSRLLAKAAWRELIAKQATYR